MCVCVCVCVCVWKYRLKKKLQSLHCAHPMITGGKFHIISFMLINITVLKAIHKQTYYHIYIYIYIYKLRW